MELGLSTHLFVYQPLDEKLLKLIRSLGFTRVEIWGMRPHFDYENIDRVKQLAKCAAGLGIDIHSVHAPFYTHVNDFKQGHSLSLADADYNARQVALAHTQKVLELMPILGAKLLVAHAGGLKDDFSQSRLDNLKRSIEQLLPLLHKHNLKLALENIATPLSTTENLLKLLEVFEAEWLGVCLDIGHAQLNENVERAILNCGHRLMGIHASDNDGRSDLHYLPGEGIIDWQNVINALRNVCYGGVINLELRYYANRPDLLARLSRGMHDRFGFNLGVIEK